MFLDLICFFFKASTHFHNKRDEQVETNSGEIKILTIYWKQQNLRMGHPSTLHKRLFCVVELQVSEAEINDKLMWQKLLFLCVKGAMQTGSDWQTNSAILLVYFSLIHPSARLRAFPTVCCQILLSFSSLHCILLSSLLSSLWHWQRGGKMESSVCLSDSKVISLRGGEGNMGGRTPQGNYGVTAHSSA